MIDKNRLFDDINRNIADKLEAGTVPWHKSWISGYPANFITKKPYSGINFLSLMTNNFPSPYYMTYLQCANKGGKIKQGEKGTEIIFWKIMTGIKPDKDDVKTTNFPLIRFSYVFNLSQTTLWDEFKDVDDKQLILPCEDIVKNIPGLLIKNHLAKCFYSPLLDYVSMVPIEKFDSPEEYYASEFHEIVHWTGHPLRLARDLPEQYADAVYSKEELIAEIGSAYLCAIAGISPKVIDNSASYIQGWMNKYKGDNHLFTDAALAAQKAVEYILGDKLSEVSSAA